MCANCTKDLLERREVAHWPVDGCAECEPAAIATNAPHDTDAAAMDDTDEAAILGRLAQATGLSQTEVG